MKTKNEVPVIMKIVRPSMVEATDLVLAAPELLASLKELLENELREIGVPLDDVAGGMWLRAKNAISKAEGK